MDDYAGRVLADRYRLPLPPSDEYELTETRAFDTYSGQEVLVRQVPLPEVVEAEVLDADGLPDGFTARDGAFRGPSAHSGRTAGGDRFARTATRRPADPAVRRAVEAAQAAARIPDHPRLDQVFDVFAEGGSLWIVSELVAARPLAALLAEEPLTPYRAAEVASDILMALRVLHAHGWVHRNITARTVLVCDDGRVMLTGLAAGAAEEALCGYDPVPVRGVEDEDSAPDALPEGEPDGTAGASGGSGDATGAGPTGAGGVGGHGGFGGAGRASDSGGFNGVTGGFGGAAGASGGPATGAGSVPADPEAARRAAIEARAAGPLPLPGAEAGPGAPGGLARRTPETGGDVRAARAGAIAAYRAGARAAARVQEAQQSARAALPGARPPAEGDPRADAAPGTGTDREGRPVPPGRIADPYGVQAPSWHGTAPPTGTGLPLPPGDTGRHTALPWGGPGSDADQGRGHGASGAGSGFPGVDEGAAGTGYEGLGADRGVMPGAVTGPDTGHGSQSAGSGLPGADQGAAGSFYDGPDADRGTAGPGHGAPGAGHGGPGAGHGAPGAGYGPPGSGSGSPGAGRGVPGTGYGIPGARQGASGPSHGTPSTVPTPAVPSQGRPGPGGTPVRWDAPAAPVRWDAPVADAPVPRGPATALAAERARQARMAVVGPVTERWAPEQAGPVHENWQLAAPIGPATDLWALGALLFRAVQGHAPYPEESTAELVQMVCAEPPAYAEECGPLRPVVESLLRQDPTERLDFEELSGWLRSLVRSAPEPEAGAHVIAAPPAGPSRLPVVRRRGELVRRRRAGLPATHGRHKRAKQRSRSPRSLGRNLLLLILLLLAAAIAYAMLFMPKADHDGAASGDRTRTAGEASPAPAKSDGAPRTGPSPSSSRTDDSPSGPAGSTEAQTTVPGLADGFTLREDSAGFQVAVAKDWTRTPRNDRGQVVYSRGAFELIVVPGRDSAAEFGSDPMAYQREKEGELQGYRASSWATSSGLRTIQVGGRTMAEGQFTWTGANGQQLFVRNLAILLDGRYHVVQVRGPETQRDQVTRLYEQASATYQYTG